MKKLMMCLAVLAMLSGCGLYQSVCHPTVDQQNTVQQYKAQAQSLLAFLQTQVSDSTVQAAIAGLTVAISLYDQVLAGVCISADLIANAVNSVNSTKTMAMMKMGYKG